MVRMPARAIVAAVDGAAARWRDPTYRPRVRARNAIGERTGYPLAAVENAFQALFTALRRDAIEAVIVDELGSLDVLDRFVARSGRPPAYAAPLGRICVVSSRTTIGVALIPALFALCAKCEVTVKDREDHFVAAFFETLALERRELAEAATARSWDGAERAGELGDYDAVVAFGSDATLTQLAAQLPINTRFIPHASKSSAGYVGREALHDAATARTIALAAARDLLLYESEGCLSLHVLFVERGGAVGVESFVELLADAMATGAGELAPARPDVRIGARRAAARDLTAFRAESAYSDRQAGYLAVLDPPFEEPPLFLPRTIAVRSVEAVQDALRYLQRHCLAVEALALAQHREDLVELAVSAGASRVTGLGDMQAPPLGVFHGGRPRVAEFVRWVVDET
jgi:hypothetical protein